MFLQVSVCPWGGHVWLLWGVHGCSGGACMVALGGHVWLLWGGMCGFPRGEACVVALGGACMVALGGMCGCSRGHVWLLQGGMVALGACVVALGGCAWDTTRYGDMVNERAVRILLECILVCIIFVENCIKMKKKWTAGDGYSSFSLP